MTFPFSTNSVQQEAYSFTLKYKGLAEIVGTKNNRMIVVAHRLTGCSPENPSNDVDSTIPWCSSWMNLAIICANIRINPGMMFKILQDRGVEIKVIKECFVFADIPFEIWRNHNTERSVVMPTWSAASKSWDSWGEFISLDQAKRGDVVRLVRDGGGHVAFLDDDSIGLLYTRLLGGNQADKVCDAKYLSNRIVQARRV